VTQPVILVVDDDDLNREVMDAYLSAEDYTVYLAHNGTTGLQMSADLRPNLIILDVKMPDMDGYEVCYALKQNAHTRPIPVMIMTGFNSPEDRAKGIASGADAFVPRPFDAEDLLKKVRILVQRTLR
jgi:CheY-like chemotaxis protein